MPPADRWAPSLKAVTRILLTSRYAIDVTGDPYLLGDSEKVQQILINLLSNASKFTEPGGRVTIPASKCADGTVALSMADTGIGIPEDKQAAIFDPFVQMHCNLRRSVDGTGLGLAISRDLARGMKGDLVVKSVEGGGSTFILTLPGAERL